MDYTRMTLKATIKLVSGETIVRYYDCFDDLGHWMERHHGQFTSVDSQWLRPDDSKQGMMGA